MKINCYTETLWKVTCLTGYLNTQTFEPLRQTLVVHVFCFILETVIDWGLSCPVLDHHPSVSGNKRNCSKISRMHLWLFEGKIFAST